ncbi:MAG: CBS domain-containing protein [Methanosarcinales archaeon]|nr:CBS domain-containing protein [Methanosarcinales archaeon]
METDMPIRDIMTQAVIYADISAMVSDVGLQMVEHNIDSVVIKKDGVPVGIVTERDLTRKIIPGNLRPDSLALVDVMSSPLITITSDMSVNSATKKMLANHVRRLPVFEGNNLVGIVDDSDIIAISAQLNEILHDLIAMNQSLEPIHEPEPGNCEVCGLYSADLKLTDGELLCDTCKEEAELG